MLKRRDSWLRLRDYARHRGGQGWCLRLKHQFSGGFLWDGSEALRWQHAGDLLQLGALRTFELILEDVARVDCRSLEKAKTHVLIEGLTGGLYSVTVGLDRVELGGDLSPL